MYFAAVCLFIFFVIFETNKTHAIGVFDCRALTMRVLGTRRRWKVRAARSEKTCVITNTRSILISSPPFTFDNLFGFARGRRYRRTQERSILDTRHNKSSEGLSYHTRICCCANFKSSNSCRKLNFYDIYLEVKRYIDYYKLLFFIYDTNISNI